MPTLLGPDGQPIKKEILEDEIAAPSLAGLRNAWAPSVASGLTPQRLALLLRQASEGDSNDYLILAEEMEERDLHYASVIGTRKRAIGGVELMVKAGSESAKDQEIAEDVRHNLVEDPNFVEALDDLLDGIAKGFSVVEILWDRGKKWKPRGYRHVDPRFFTFDRESGRQIRLIDEKDPMGVPLEPFKFITHVPRLKSGLPIRGGLARLAAMGYMCKGYTVKDWMVFLEVYGMPLRIGRYGKNHNQKDIQKLIQAVSNIGTDAAAILPESMRIEFEGAATGSGTTGAQVFLDTAEWWDRQTSKAVLGQTASTEGTPGKLGNDDTQDDVRRDILRSDCRQLGLTLDRDIVRSYVDLNYGPQEFYPRILLPVQEPEDVELIVKAVKELSPLGLKVKASEVRGKLGLSEPQDGDEVIGGQPAPVEDPEDVEREANAANGQAMDPEAEIEEAALDGWKQQMEPIVQPIETILAEANSYDELIDKLATVELDTSDLVKQLAEATFKARAAGDVDE